MTEQKNNKEDTSFSVKTKQSRYIVIRENIYKALSSHALLVYMALRYDGDYAREESLVKRNIKALCNTARVSRTRCFEALNELEAKGLLQRKSDPGYQNIYLISDDLGHFLPKEQEVIPEIPQQPIDQLPVQDVDGVVQDVDGVVQDVDTITINSFHQSSHLKPFVDSKSTAKRKEYKEDLLFMEFYKLYPNKQKPIIAYKAFLKHKPTPEFVTMLINDLKVRIEGNWKGRDKSKIPFPATYLNGREWEGEIYDNVESTTKKSTKYKTWDEIIEDVA